MKLTNILAVTAAALSIGAVANANGGHVGLLAGSSSADFDCLESNFLDCVAVGDSNMFSGSVTEVGIFAGYRWNLPNFFVGVEAELSTAEYDLYATSNPYDVDTKRLKAQIGKSAGQFTYYGFLGISAVDIDRISSSYPLSGTGMSFGAGIEYDVTDNFGLRLEALMENVDVEHETQAISEDHEWSNRSVRVGAFAKF